MGHQDTLLAPQLQKKVVVVVVMYGCKTADSAEELIDSHFLLATQEALEMLLLELSQVNFQLLAPRDTEAARPQDANTRVFARSEQCALQIIGGRLLARRPELLRRRR